MIDMLRSVVQVLIYRYQYWYGTSFFFFFFSSFFLIFFHPSRRFFFFFFFYSSSFPFSLLPSSITFIGKLCIELLTVRTLFFRFGWSLVDFQRLKEDLFSPIFYRGYPPLGKFLILIFKPFGVWIQVFLKTGGW